MSASTLYVLSQASITTLFLFVFLQHLWWQVQAAEVYMQAGLWDKARAAGATSGPSLQQVPHGICRKEVLVYIIFILKNLYFSLDWWNVIFFKSWHSNPALNWNECEWLMSSLHIVGAVCPRSLQGSPCWERWSRWACETRARPRSTGALRQTERLAKGNLISCVWVFIFFMYEWVRVVLKENLIFGTWLDTHLFELAFITIIQGENMVEAIIVCSSFKSICCWDWHQKS